MLFTSITFIFCFLPLVLLVYYVLPKPARNAWMILSSLVFYVWGEPMHLWVLLLSVIFNYGGALWIEVENRKFHRDLLLSLMIAANLGLLAWFKYSAFFVENWNHLRDLVGLKALAVPVIHLPLGISFFTFQAISYLLDVYRGTVPVERRLDRYTLYACLFPHLLAGPIVRYKDISGELGSRSITSLDFAAGIQRFILGLAKKLMIANTLGQMVDEQLALSMGELSTPVAWLFAVGYALQIYYDFSAYSDMAIGLGRMFGFHFPENFNFPYAARTVQGFWRGWHISLSTWFRDYLYIPMGGSRNGPQRQYIALVSVFTLCGLWHGASWNFVLWGLWHGFFLTAERLGLAALLSRTWALVQHAYTLGVVLTGWVLFRAQSLEQASLILKCMFGQSAPGGELRSVLYYGTPLNLITLFTGLILAFPVVPWITRRFWCPLAQKIPVGMRVGVEATVGLAILVIFILSVSHAISMTYNPFIYFRF